MKRIVALAALVMLAAAVVGAEGIDLGDFPLGTWLDSNWDAYWEFSTGNIRILDADGGVHYDFSQATVENWSLGPGTGGLVISFYCPETEKEYTITKPVTNLDLELKIVRQNADDYVVTMNRQ